MYFRCGSAFAQIEIVACAQSYELEFSDYILQVSFHKVWTVCATSDFTRSSTMEQGRIILPPIEEVPASVSAMAIGSAWPIPAIRLIPETHNFSGVLSTETSFFLLFEKMEFEGSDDILINRQSEYRRR